jgi:beta-N-acetylhexosaminidase
MRSCAIYGCAGTVLSAAERDFFREVQPWGFILFARNINDSVQVKALVEQLRDTVEDGQAPVLIDQEGGRVARLKPPHWRMRPPAARFGALYADNPQAGREATYLNARLIAHDLANLGINVDCLPVLDVPAAGAHDIIGDRAFAADPATIIALGKAQIEGLMDGGVLPDEAHSRPWPGRGRQPSGAAQGLGHGGRTFRQRFRYLSQP